jgi:hypothetical protein
MRPKRPERQLVNHTPSEWAPATETQDEDSVAFDLWWNTLSESEKANLTAEASFRLDEFDKEIYHSEPEGTIAKACIRARMKEIWLEQFRQPNSSQIELLL